MEVKIDLRDLFEVLKRHNLKLETAKSIAFDVMLKANNKDLDIESLYGPTPAAKAQAVVVPEIEPEVVPEVEAAPVAPKKKDVTKKRINFSDFGGEAPSLVNS